MDKIICPYCNQGIITATNTTTNKVTWAHLHRVAADWSAGHATKLLAWYHCEGCQREYFKEVSYVELVTTEEKEGSPV